MYKGNAMFQYSTVTQKGRVTIPARLRERLGFTRGKRVRFFQNPENKQELILQPMKDFRDLKGTFKSNKRYDKKAVRITVINDVVTGKV